MTNKSEFSISHIEGQSLYRGFSDVAIRNVDDEARTVELSFSSEASIDRYFGVEVLGHDDGEVNMGWINSGNAPLLLDHEWEKQIGIVESASIGTDRKRRAVVRFGKGVLADEAFNDVKDGIRRNVSVGYFINRMVMEEGGEDETPDQYRVIDWEPFEVSIVAVPADRDVGVGRTPNGKQPRKIEILTPQTRKKENVMPPKENQVPDDVQANSEPQSRNVDITVIENDAVRKERDRVKSIRAIAKSHNMIDFAERAVEDGTSIAQFQDDLLSELSKREPEKVRTVKEDDGLIGLSAKEVQSFSLLRAISAVVNNAPELAPFEMEVAKATRQKFKHRSFEGKIQVPLDVLIAGSRKASAQRDLTKGGATSGAELVGVDHMGESFIDALRGRLLISQLGARFMTGLVGDVTIPKLASGATAYWVTEGNAPTESTQVTGAVNLAPKTVGAFSDISRKLLLQSSPDAETLVRDDLMKVLARAIDTAAYSGSGSSGQPTGIVNVSGIGSVDYDTGITFGDMVDLESEIAIDNALMGSLHYVTTPALAGSMKQTLKSSGVSGYIWENGQVNGYQAHTTSLMVAAEVLFGNWEDLIVGNWGVLDLKIDESALATSGGIRVIALQDMDVAVRHAQSFARAFT